MLFALHADICDLASGFLATDYMNFLQSSGTQGQNKETKEAQSYIYIYIYIYIYKSSINTQLYVKQLLVFLVYLILMFIHQDR